MSQQLTKDHLDAFVAAIKQDTKDQIGSLRYAMNARFDGVETRLGSLEDDMSKVKHAILDYIGTDRALHNLVRQLHTKGIEVDDAKIFAV